jgi:hypothetical protein
LTGEWRKQIFTRSKKKKKKKDVENENSALMNKPMGMIVAVKGTRVVMPITEPSHWSTSVGRVHSPKSQGKSNHGLREDTRLIPDGQYKILTQEQAI